VRSREEKAVGRGHVSGVLAEHADGFRGWLLAQGYTEGSAARLVHLMAHLSRWMDVAGLGAGGLTPPVVERFMAARRAEGYVGWRTSQSLVPLVTYLRGVGVVEGDDAPGEPSEFEELLGRCDTYLVAERDLAVASRCSYLAVAHRFLAWVDHADIPLGSLRAATVSEFVRLECARRAPGSASSTTTGLRSLLRFFYLHGITPSLLSGLVESIGLEKSAVILRSLARKLLKVNMSEAKIAAPSRTAVLMRCCNSCSRSRNVSLFSRGWWYRELLRLFGGRGPGRRVSCRARTRP
jgi:hypothetical protein